jgi:RNA polymerase sigma-70 factor (ECF subfamily)
MSEQRLLEAAAEGDEAAFAALVAPHREQLHAVCSRMLRSPHDADDALQDTLLRAWRGLPRFAGGSALRTWLYRIATNVCLSTIARRQQRATTPDDATDWLDPETQYEQREAVELVVVAALQNLPPRQRSVFILRDVVGFTPAEVAGMSGASRASVNSTLQRAREAVDKRPAAVGEPRVRGLARELVDAVERGDVSRIVRTLAPC